MSLEPNKLSLAPEPRASYAPKWIEPLAQPKQGNVRNMPRPSPSAFYEDLEVLLKEEMRQQPEKLDIRLKLAELYSQTHRVSDFIQHARRTRAFVTNPKNSQEWRQILTMGRMLQPGEPLFNELADEAIEFITPQAVTQTANYSRIGDEARFKKPLEDLAAAYEEVRKDVRFLAEFDAEMVQVAGYPSPLEPARRLSEYLGGAQIYLKRDDMGSRLSHITSVIVGQALLAKRMGKKTLIATSHNGRSGVLVASVAARLGLQAIIFMNAEQMQIQRSNVFRMWLCGADVQEADPKNRDIRKAAFDHWARFTNETFLVMGLDAGPHPYPMMMLEFTSLIGRECRRQIHAHIKKAPDVIVARSGENADAIGLFPSFLKAASTRLVCVGASDTFAGVDITAASPKNPGIYNPSQQPLTMKEEKQAARILEGLEYPSVVRETAWLKATGRVEYVEAQSMAAKKAITDLSRCEGIIPAIETAYALAWACQEASTMSKDQSVVVFLGENVEKNIWEIGKAMGVPL